MALRRIVLVMIITVGLASAEGPRVTVNEGILVGKTVTFSENRFINKTRDVDLFLGVPYAAPPIRFAPPTNMTSWSGERNATEFSPACEQTNTFDFFTSEDCLYLNVYAPTSRTSGMAVMVWIHGGSFNSGSAMIYDHYGVPLAVVGDVIVVAINYRLAIFGQFSTEDDSARGNVGMLDQAAALKWIYENIEAFGGDKDRITIFGESAGSASVSFHLVSKLSRPYFSQAIMQSGNVFSSWAFEDDPDRERRLSRDLGLALGCDVSTSSILVECLRGVDARNLSNTADQIYSDHYSVYPVTLDGVFLEDSPLNLYRKGDFAKIPILTGFNKDEGTLFLYTQAAAEYIGSPTPPPVSREVYLASMHTYLTSYVLPDEVVLNSVDQEYTHWATYDNTNASYFDALVAFFGDFAFNCPTDALVRAHYQAGGTVYKYYMPYAPTRSYVEYQGLAPTTPWLGAGHAEDITFVWGIPFIDELYHIKGHNMTDEENALSVKFMEFWTNFAKSGDPSKPSVDAEPGVGEDLWPSYSIPELNYKELAPGFAVGRAVRARQCHFWNSYMPTLLTHARDIDELEKDWQDSFSIWKTGLTGWQQEFEEYKQGSTCN
ncbi:cholinesterase-like [Diadema antillarum]|uniref:cholinesterase-like n=1 Tax=Diadema antillarum TaxID=105358 RepID=UPI003A84F32C